MLPEARDESALILPGVGDAGALVLDPGLDDEVMGFLGSSVVESFARGFAPGAVRLSIGTDYIASLVGPRGCSSTL